jgi:hypothetical protein
MCGQHSLLPQEGRSAPRGMVSRRRPPPLNAETWGSIPTRSQASGRLAEVQDNSTWTMLRSVAFLDGKRSALPGLVSHTPFGEVCFRDWQCRPENGPVRWSTRNWPGRCGRRPASPWRTGSASTQASSASGGAPWGAAGGGQEADRGRRIKRATCGDGDPAAPQAGPNSWPEFLKVCLTSAGSRNSQNERKPSVPSTVIGPQLGCPGRGRLAKVQPC